MQYHWFLKSFSNYINTNYVRLGISSDQKDAIVLLWTNWVPKMNAYTDPNTYGSISITDINALYIATKFITTGVQGQVSSNPSVTLSGADYANLGIAKPKAHRTHVPAVRFAPIVTCISNTTLMPVFFAFNPSMPTKKKKPKDVAAIGVKIAFVGAGDPPPAAAAYVTQDSEGNTEFEMIVTADKVGKEMWIICFYISPTGEAGPDSAPFMVVIV
jgi:hypothetical protein